MPEIRESSTLTDQLPLERQPSARPSMKARAKGTFLLRLLSSRLLVSILLASTLLATLTAGLFPFRAPENDATWVTGEDGIQFNQQGTAISDAMLGSGDGGSGPCTLELWLKPASAWTSGTSVDFYNQARSREFAISQDGPDLLLRLVDRPRADSPREQVLVVKNAFHQSEFLLTLTSNGQNAVVYINGQTTLDDNHFPLSSEDLAAQLILGNEPRRNHAWAGEVKGLAVYASDLSANEVVQHARNWIAAGRPTASAARNLVALYLFRGPWDKAIPNAVTGGVGLTLPQRFLTVDQLRFESAASEKRFDKGYRDDAIINVFGFVPLGCIAAWFWARFMRGGKGAVLTAVFTGVATSFVIEYFQSYLPTRYSGTTDLITNSLGTVLGVAVYLATWWLFAKKIGLDAGKSNPSSKAVMR